MAESEMRIDCVYGRFVKFECKFNLFLDYLILVLSLLLYIDGKQNIILWIADILVVETEKGLGGGGISSGLNVPCAGKVVQIQRAAKG